MAKTKRKKHKTYTAQVISHKNNLSTPRFIISVFGAFILDTLRTIKNMVVCIILIAIIIVALISLIGWIKIEPIYKEYDAFASRIVNESTEETFRPEEATYIYDSAGELLVKLRGNQDADYLEYNSIPGIAVDAFIAVEDRNFWDNSGIDLRGLMRVGVDAVRTKGKDVHGASTITQQLARNVFLTHEVSIERKAKEMLIALKLTKKYQKHQIMEYYVNNICFANAYYGLEAASKGYFNKSSKDLTLSEIVYLCAIPNRPEYYNPYKFPERAIERRDKILGDMLELGYITQSEYNEAIKYEIHIEKPSYEFNNYQSTFAIDCATRYIMKENGFGFKYSFETMNEYNNYKKDYDDAYTQAKYKLSTGGYKVYTTLDSNIQMEMQSVLDEKLSFNTETNEETGIYKLQGAMTVVDNSTGKVKAVIGGRSQQDNKEVYSLNRAYQSNRQPGSSIKPLVVYTPALMNGYTPETTVFNIDVKTAKKKGVDVQSLKGPAMTLRSALENSKNGVAWQIFDKLGARNNISYLENMGFASVCPNDYYNSASLGGLTYGVTTVEMAGAYSTLVNHGYYREPTCIDKMLDNKGNDIYRDKVEQQIYTAKASDTMVDMMKGVLTKGTASKLGWYKSTDNVAACKTGTTNDSKDGWLCGFTPQYTVTVWVGYDQPKTLSSLYGATYPGQIWKDSMLKLIENRGVLTEFDKSTEYESLDTDEELPQSAYELYLPGRDDSEVLSDGYTVADYRNDRVIGEQIDPIISKMYNLDKSSSTYVTDMNTLYYEGCSIIETVYSRKYTAELQNKLDTAFHNCLNN